MKYFKKLEIIFLLSLFLFSVPQLFSQHDVLVFEGGRIITITRGIIEQGTIVIEKGRIVDIGKNIFIPERSKVIDVSSFTILPGLIDSFTDLGAVDVEEDQRDNDEATHPLTPHLRIIDALNPANRFIPLARNSGITTALTAPGEGNLLSGQSALIHLFGEKMEEMIVKFPVAVHANLGELPKLRYGEKGRMPSTRMGEAALLRQTLIDVQGYIKKMEDYERKKEQSNEKIIPPDNDLKLQSLIPVIKRELPLIVRANRYDDILTALRIGEEFDLRIILNHGAEAYRLAETLADRKIPVLVGPFSSYYQRMETKNSCYQNVAQLSRRGVKFAFQTGGVKNFSTLINQAKTAIKYGLSLEEAYKGLTLYPAQILGLEGELGSLEKGKIADIVVFSGDPLEETSTVKLVIIKGKIMHSCLNDIPHSSLNYNHEILRLRFYFTEMYQRNQNTYSASRKTTRTSEAIW